MEFKNGCVDVCINVYIKERDGLSRCMKVIRRETELEGEGEGESASAKVGETGRTVGAARRRRWWWRRTIRRRRRRRRSSGVRKRAM
jgi:hypothetical protein